MNTQLTSVAIPALSGTGTGECPLVLGECVQGRLENGPDFLITLPIHLCSRAEFTIDPALEQVVVTPPDRLKARAAVSRYLAESGLPSGGRLHIETPVRPSLGFGTSTADITASLRAAAAAWERTLEPDEISRRAVAIEPSDGSMYPGSVAYALRLGQVLERFGPLPPLVALVVVTGDGVDTLAFDQQREHFRYSPEEHQQLETAWGLVRQACQQRSLALLGRATTLSARLHQRLLPNAWLQELERCAPEVGAAGVSVAHSGSLASMLLDPSAADFPQVRERARRELERIAPGGWIEVSGCPQPEAEQAAVLEASP